MKKYLLGMFLISLIFLTTGCKKSIVGKWKSIDSETEYYYIFNKDKTCSYEMTVARLDCKYEEDGKNLIITYNGNDKPSPFTYRFEDNIFILTDSAGRDNKFSKEK